MYTGKCKRALGRLQRRYKTAGYRPIRRRYSNSRCFFLLQKSTSIQLFCPRRRRRFCRNNCPTNSCRIIAPNTSLDRRRRARSNRRLKLDWRPLPINLRLDSLTSKPRVSYALLEACRVLEACREARIPLPCLVVGSAESQWSAARRWFKSARTERHSCLQQHFYREPPAPRATQYERL